NHTDMGRAIRHFLHKCLHTNSWKCCPTYPLSSCHSPDYPPHARRTAVISRTGALINPVKTNILCLIVRQEAQFLLVFCAATTFQQDQTENSTKTARIG